MMLLLVAKKCSILRSKSQRNNGPAFLRNQRCRVQHYKLYYIYNTKVVFFQQKEYLLLKIFLEAWNDLNSITFLVIIRSLRIDFLQKTLNDSNYD